MAAASNPVRAAAVAEAFPCAECATWLSATPTTASGVSGKDGRERAGTGRDHQRPLKRHAVLRLGAVSMAIAGFGQSASTPAMIATTSASVGVGVTLLTDTAVL